MPRKSPKYTPFLQIERAWPVSFAPRAIEVRTEIQVRIPIPKTKGTKKRLLAKVSAASSVTPSLAIMIVSTSPISI